MRATYRNNIEIVNVLVDSGANVNAKNYDLIDLFVLHIPGLKKLMFPTTLKISNPAILTDF